MRTTACSLILTTTLVMSVGCFAPSAVADGTMSWQLEMLYTPTPGQIKRENQGFVYIYDGLTDAQVAQVLDDQFDRIESMMFIHTIVTDDAGAPREDSETGELILEDDDC